MNYSKFYGYIISIKKGFLLNFRIWGNGTEWMDTLLPTPNIVKKLGNSYIVSWLLEGFFLTEKNQKFLNDAISRFILTFEKFGAYRVEWISWINLNKLTPNDVLHCDAYNLRDDIAPYLEPLKKEKKDYRALELLASCTKYKESDDAFFDWLRFKIYDFVKQNGKEALTLEYCKELAIIGYEIMGHKKGISTPLAKAKNIYNWVMENYNPKGSNWNYKRKLSDEEYEMQKKEIALKNAKMRAEKTKNKVYDAIKELKEKGEKVTGEKIMKLSGVSKNSALKYLRQAREEGLI